MSRDVPRVANLSRERGGLRTGELVKYQDAVITNEAVFDAGSCQDMFSFLLVFSLLSYLSFFFGVSLSVTHFCEFYESHCLKLTNLTRHRLRFRQNCRSTSKRSWMRSTGRKTSLQQQMQPLHPVPIRWCGMLAESKPKCRSVGQKPSRSCFFLHSPAAR